MATPPASSTSSLSLPSFSVGGVTIEAIMVQLQCMDARLDNLSDELCQVTTCVSRIAKWQAHLSGFVASPTPSLEVSEEKDIDNGDSNGGDADEDEASSSSGDKEMIASQWLTIFHAWQKGGVVLGMRVVMYLGGELV